MVRESALDYSTVHGIDYTDISFLCYQGSVLYETQGYVGKYTDRWWRPRGGSEPATYLFSYPPVFTVNLVFRKSRDSMDEVQAVEVTFTYPSYYIIQSA